MTQSNTILWFFDRILTSSSRFNLQEYNYEVSKWCFLKTYDEGNENIFTNIVN